MENNSIKKKVNRIGLAGKIVSIILIVLMSIATLGCLIGGILLAVLPKDAVTVDFNVDTGVTVGDSLLGSVLDDIPDNYAFDVPSEELNVYMAANDMLHLDLSDMHMEKTEQGLKVNVGMTGFQLKLSQLTGAVFSGLVYCAASIVIFVFLLRLSNAFRHCDTPFSDLVIRRMTAFGWVLLIGSVVSSVAEAIANKLILRNFSLTSSLGSLGSFGTGFNLRLAPILIALVLFFLTMIFRYGAQLQKESDETL